MSAPIDWYSPGRIFRVDPFDEWLDTLSPRARAEAMFLRYTVPSMALIGIMPLSAVIDGFVILGKMMSKSTVK